MKIKTKLFFLFLFLIAIDQIIKNISSFSICNKNIAWSIPLSPAIFYLAWILIVVVLIYLFLKTKYVSQKIFLVLIFSGAISNMIDRLRLGCVVDHIDLKFWPIFNLADVYITIGIILLIVINFKKIRDTRY